jgi:hypothetical protein
MKNPFQKLSLESEDTGSLEDSGVADSLNDFTVTPRTDRKQVVPQSLIAEIGQRQGYTIDNLGVQPVTSMPIRRKRKDQMINKTLRVRVADLARFIRCCEQQDASAAKVFQAWCEAYLGPDDETP